MTIVDVTTVTDSEAVVHLTSTSPDAGEAR